MKAFLGVVAILSVIALAGAFEKETEKELGKIYEGISADYNARILNGKRNQVKLRKMDEQAMIDAVQFTLNVLTTDPHMTTEICDGGELGLELIESKGNGAGEKAHFCKLTTVSFDDENIDAEDVKIVSMNLRFEGANDSEMTVFIPLFPPFKNHAPDNYSPFNIKLLNALEKGEEIQIDFNWLAGRFEKGVELKDPVISYTYPVVLQQDVFNKFISFFNKFKMQLRLDK